MHMLPEAREKLPKYTELMLCIGFFVVYLVDEIVHIFYGTESHHEVTQATSYGTGSVERSSLVRNADGEMRERCCGDAGNPMMCHVSHTEPCNKSSSGIVGLLCALFVHSFLEGLAIGLQNSATEVCIDVYVGFI